MRRGCGLQLSRTPFAFLFSLEGFYAKPDQGFNTPVSLVDEAPADSWLLCFLAYAIAPLWLLMQKPVVRSLDHRHSLLWTCP